MELIADALSSRRNDLVAAGLDAIASRISAYQRANASLREDVRAHLAKHHDLLRMTLRRRYLVDAKEMEFVWQHPAMRARCGISLADFLEAHRAYQNILWDAISQASLQSSAAAVQALSAARYLISYADIATTVASGAYLEAQQMLLADRDRVQRDLLEDLFTAQPPSTAARLAAAPRGRVRERARCLVVAALPTEPPEDESVLRLAAGTLANAIRSQTPPLAVTRHGEVIIVRAVAQGERP